MPASASIEIYGVRDALRELQQIDKKQKFAAIAKIKSAGGDMLAAARAEYPSDGELQSALEGWTGNGRTAYSKAKANSGLKIQIGGRSRGNAYAIVTLVQNDPAAALFDIAGLRDGSQGKPGGPDRLGRKRQPKQSKAFIDALDRGFVKAQRGMWRNVREIRRLSEGNLRKALDEVAASVNRKLVD